MAIERPSAPLACIDLFSGCGGLSLGAKLAGLDVVHAVEFDRQAASTYSANFPNTTLYNTDVRQFSTNILTTKPNILLAGPPCQPFSASNQRSRGPDHPNNLLYKEAIRITAELKPEVVIVENVEGFAQGGARSYHDDLCAELSKLGFHVSSQVLCAVDFGVPQRRRRLFVIATRRRQKPIIGAGEITPITVNEAIEDLPELAVGADQDELPYKQAAASSYAVKMRTNSSFCTGNLVTKNAAHIVDRYPYIRQGGNWRDIPAMKFATYQDARRCHTGIYHRLKGDEPAKVIGNFRKNMLIHPVEHRGLSVREAARLQSFPDHFVFRGSIGKQQQQVGNAVPPELAKAVVMHAIETVE